MFFLNIHDGHHYGDDWAQYLKEALNISQGLPFYQSEYIFNPLSLEYAPPHYPPGYPLLLAPLVYFTKTAILPILYLNTILVCGLLFSTYFFFKAKTSKINAICLSVIFTYLTIIIDMKGHILSDIACSLFVVIYLAIRAQIKNWTYKNVLILIVICTFAVLIRTQSILIVFAELCLWIWSVQINKEKQKKFLLLPPGLLIFIGVIVTSIIINVTVFQTPNSSLIFYKNIYYKVLWSKDLWQVIGFNLNYMLSLLNEIFYRKMNDYFFQFFVSIITASTLFLFLVGAVVSLRKKVEFEIVFLCLMIILILITPVYQGLRYLLPAVPIYMWLVARGLNIILVSVNNIKSYKAAIFCTLIFLFLGIDDIKRIQEENKVYSLNAIDSSAFKYINENVNKNDIILFTKPRLLTLLTERKSMVISTQASIEESKHQFDSMEVKYLLFCNHLNEDAVTRFLNSSPKKYTDSIKINESYILYSLKQN